MKLARWLSALVLPALGGCISHINAPADPVQPGHTGFEERLNIRYSPEGWPETLYADVYVVERDRPGPAVLVVHGGGWEGRSRDDMTDIARKLARHGFTAMNIDYRFAPDYRYPAQLQDLQQALDWLRHHHRELAVDPQRIAGLGYSSGAHLLSLLATVSTSEHPDRPPWNPDQQGLVAVVAGGLPADLREFESGRLLKQLLGDTREAMPERYERASPAAWVTADTPPHFLFHGTWDDLVPVSQARDFHRRLETAGVDNQLYLMHGHGHITTFLFHGLPLDEALAFLRHHSAD
ncbi:MAG: alpha/beta hydrolase [Marinobacter sp.]